MSGNMQQHTKEGNRMMTMNVPTVLEQRLLGTPMSYETRLSRRELQTLFYVGRKLELIGCYTGPVVNASRTVKEQKSFGYIMTKDDGRPSWMRFEPGNVIIGVSAGNGFYA